MVQINLLDDKTINKIAAGEVVERPVSVVKELVENAIDAGSDAISVEVKGGGIDYIRVTDNGTGIDKENIKKAFLRHATSKIKTAEDLLGVTSLGFRGEALSSVAAVSQIELMTKTKDDILGYRYCIHGGKEMSFDEAGLPDGTTIIVRNLFYNTPARRKFLKSSSTERNYITELMERLILSHPDISFKYTVDNDVKLSSGGDKDVMANVYGIFGRDIQKALVSVDVASENCEVTGFVGKPEISRGNRNYELFFVNDRYIKSNVLSSAVEEAFKPFLMLHKFPFVILYLNIPSQFLDVNVHPAKTVIRFMEEQSVYEIVKNAVSDAISRRELIPDVDLFENKDNAGPTAKNTVSVKDEDSASEEIPEPFETKRIEEFKRSYDIDTVNTSNTVDHVSPAKKAVSQITLFDAGFLKEENVKKHRIIGQVFDTYWLIEYDEKLYVIDQHAAHEKVLYEKFRAQISQNAVTSQMISPPFIMSLSQSQADTLSEYLAYFNELGFMIEHFGGREYAISSAPDDLPGMNGQDYLIAVLDELAVSSRLKEPDQIKDRIATMACKAAVKGNMRLSTAEADALITQLLSLENPYNCPHGRPTIVSFSKSELEKMFKRIV
ncbi:MAG: DNA mismatch repair endonuclease MutL [Lachnospiraceae bacterium]|nr:DNA mismatch repair endonuclease MutL [Lachnospiraceae bacterium]